MNLKENTSRGAELQQLFQDLIQSHEMSFALIDLNSKTPDIFGYNLDRFIYPASMYKVFIGAEMLRQVGLGKFSLDREVEVIAPNDVDKDIKIFHGDTRPLLVAGDTVTIDYLLNLMLTRSDNTASNCLIDLVTRESINENILLAYGWNGSEVTRKYLDRSKDSEQYRNAPITMSCARHFAEFFYLTDRGEMVSPWVSGKLREYMSKQHEYGIRLLPPEQEYSKFYCKGGWLETNLYKQSIFSAIKTILKKRWALVRWSNDAGAITLPTGERYVLVFFSITKTTYPWKYFPTENFARRIMQYMRVEK